MKTTPTLRLEYRRLEPATLPALPRYMCVLPGRRSSLLAQLGIGGVTGRVGNPANAKIVVRRWLNIYVWSIQIWFGVEPWIFEIYIVHTSIWFCFINKIVIFFANSAIFMESCNDFLWSTKFCYFFKLTKVRKINDKELRIPVLYLQNIY